MDNFNLENKSNKINYIPISKQESKNKKFIKSNLEIIIIIVFLSLFSLLIFFFIKEYINVNSLFEKNSLLSKRTFKVNKIDEDFIADLKDILKNEIILENEIMSKHTTFKIGGPAKIFVIPKTINQIIEIIQLCKKYKVNYFILGNGSNLLVSDEGYYGVVIQINESNFRNLQVNKEDENKYTLIVGGGLLMKTLSIEACLLSLKGLEDIIDIPGTVGGGIIMNAAFKGTGLIIPLRKVKIITSEGKILELTKEECKFIRRGSMLKDKKYIVIEAIFKLEKGDQMIIQKTMTDNTKKRYEKQPMYFGSAGSFFVWFHDKHGGLYKKYKECNLVGYRVGDIMIYTYNIGFIVNLGRGTASQVMEIVTHIEKIIKDKYQIEMKREVIVIGSINDIEYY